jgi:adenine-specific DNA-methyltransferase
VSTVSVASEFNPQVDLVLHEGDCLEFLRGLPSGLAKLIVTSPPYNLGKSYEKRLDLESYLEQQGKVIEQCSRVLNDSGSLCWQVGNFVEKGRIIPLDIALYPIFESLGLHLRNRVVWHFEHGLHSSRRFSGRYEVILWFTKGDDYTFNLDAVRVPQKYPRKKHFKGPKKGQFSGNPLGKNPGDLWNIPNVKANHVEKTDHPCQFPVELVERLVLSMTNKGDWVLDPFMGVGTTAVAALMHARRAIGAEIKSEYVEIARDRIREAEEGKLRIRPSDRPVYDPNNPGVQVPPQNVQLVRGSTQDRLFVRPEAYGTSKQAPVAPMETGE